VTKRPAFDAMFPDGPDGDGGPVLAALDAAYASDAILREALRLAETAADADARDGALRFAAHRLAIDSPALAWPELDWLTLLRAEPGMRFTTVPGVPGRTVWAIRDASDADALREAIGPGQVWVRADLVRSDDWPTVRAFAADAVERTIGQERTAGRRAGSPNGKRAALVAELGADPERYRALSDDDLDRLGRERLGWLDATGDYDVVRRRVTRLRRDVAEPIKP
jgi:hypothetical protein